MADRYDEPAEVPEENRRLSIAQQTKRIYQQKINRPRWVLHMQAAIWRYLMSLGMFFHRLAPPRPPKPDFTRVIPSTLASISGNITLHFYVPKEYENQRRKWLAKADHDEDEDEGVHRRVSTLSTLSATIRRRSTTVRRWGGYPVVINFHGGGFTLGTATDDARWCGTVVDEVNAVVVSVDYRLAPEHPFPTAVEDGADAVLWVHRHASELGIDVDKIALSGFSSGANMNFTVPLRLYNELESYSRNASRQDLSAAAPISTDFHHPFDPSASSTSLSSSSTQIPSEPLHVGKSRDPLLPAPAPAKTPRAQIQEAFIPGISIKCIVPWYPSLDYTRTREERRATCSRADQELPALFTDLFDDSYLHPPKNVPLDSPYLSPGVAPTALLRAALPRDIIMHTCEWDMLLDEGQAFYQRLKSPALDKHVVYRMIPGVPHGWDKAPNPWKPTPGVREHYLRACKELRRALSQSAMPEHPTVAGSSAAPRESVALVR